MTTEQQAPEPNTIRVDANIRQILGVDFQVHYNRAQHSVDLVALKVPEVEGEKPDILAYDSLAAFCVAHADWDYAYDIVGRPFVAKCLNAMLYEKSEEYDEEPTGQLNAAAYAITMDFLQAIKEHINKKVKKNNQKA